MFAGLLFGIITGVGGLAYGVHLGVKYKSYDGVIEAFKKLFKS